MSTERSSEQIWAELGPDVAQRNAEVAVLSGTQEVFDNVVEQALSDQTVLEESLLFAYSLHMTDGEATSSVQRLRSSDPDTFKRKALDLWLYGQDQKDMLVAGGKTEKAANSQWQRRLGSKPRQTRDAVNAQLFGISPFESGEQ